MFDQVIPDPGLDISANIRLIQCKDNPCEIDIMACDQLGEPLYMIARINARGTVAMPASAVTFSQWINGQTIEVIKEGLDEGFLVTVRR
jgi:hypothetical protein